ncbi:MAG: hypothetical protein ABH814_00350 [bacterium]
MKLIPQAYAIAITNPAPFHTLGEVVSGVVPAVFGVGGLLTFSALLLGGIKYITAGGDDKAVQSAKKLLTNAIIGLVILLSSFWIMNILEAVFNYNFI